MRREILDIIIQSESAIVLFAILQNPNSTVAEIKKITNFPNTSAYRAINFLYAKRLISYKKIKRNNSMNTKIYETKFSTIKFLADKNGVKMVVK